MIRTGPDAIVIGAGIVGAACAAALAAAGVPVTVIERDFPGGGTTAAGMGHLVVMDDSPAQLALTARSLELWRQSDLPPDVEQTETGTLWIAEDDRQLEALAPRQRLFAAAGVAAEVLDSAALREAEPALAHRLAGALRVPRDGVIYPPTAAAALLERARSRGATLVRGNVESIGAHGVVVGGNGMRADFVVNACGAHAAALVAGVGIVPRKGHLVITDRHPGFCRHQVVETGYLASAHEMTAESIAFNVQPRQTGQLLIGSSRELAGWDASINRPLLSRMLDRAVSFMPGLASVSVLRTWTGFRPATPDKLPLIGSWPDIPGLLIAAGHEGLGITTAMATGEIIASIVLGRPGAIDARPYDPSRVMAAA